MTEGRIEMTEGRIEMTEGRSEWQQAADHDRGDRTAED